MKTIIIILFSVSLPLIVGSYCMQMKNQECLDGVWVRNSENFHGWQTVVGPDVISINEKNVELFFISSNRTYNYSIFGKSMLPENNLQNGFIISIDRLNMIITDNDGYSFSYFKSKNGGNINTDAIRNSIKGEWKSSNNEEYMFTNKTDDDMKYSKFIFSMGDKRFDGYWDIKKIYGTSILDISLPTLKPRMFFEITHYDTNNIYLYYMSKSGENVYLKLHRI